MVELEKETRKAGSTEGTAQAVSQCHSHVVGKWIPDHVRNPVRAGAALLELRTVLLHQRSVRTPQDSVPHLSL